MKNILIIHTGGTIAMSKNSETGSVETNQVNPLYETIKSLSSVGSVISEDFFNLPSPHITPTHMLQLAKRIETVLNKRKYDGIVVTHGTDTLEETAYFLDLVLHTEIPIVLTGAMRSSNELGSDGPRNLLAAIQTATSNEARKKGILVVFNDEIFTARHVMKTNTSNVATFQSPQSGPIGTVTSEKVLFYYTPMEREYYPVQQITKKVVLLKAYAGMESDIITAIGNTGIDGLVIEAFGLGNVPPAIVPELANLLNKHIPIVLTSRSYSGFVEDVYGYDGGGRMLKEMGIIFANGLSGQKARLKLIVALETTTSLKTLEEIFLR